MQAKADEEMRACWHVRDNGSLYFDGKGYSLATAKDYGDFEMFVDWRLLTVRGDSGLYLRGTPQVRRSGTRTTSGTSGPAGFTTTRRTRARRWR